MASTGSIGTTRAMRKVASNSPSNVSTAEPSTRSSAAAPRSVLGNPRIAVVAGSEAEDKPLDRRGVGGDLDTLEKKDEGRDLLMRALQRFVKCGAPDRVALRRRRGDGRIHRPIAPGTSPRRRLAPG